ncbi:MAG: hypothetical protein R3C10_09845 [Pirellulales bacterium]
MIIYSPAREGEQPPPRQFSLRSLIVFMLKIAILCGLLALLVETL